MPNNSKTFTLKLSEAEYKALMEMVQVYQSDGMRPESLPKYHYDFTQPFIEKLANTEEDVSSYMLRVEYDNSPDDPRRTWDNLGNMVCWHRRYDLGDKHDFSEPQDFKQQLVEENAEPQSIIGYVMDNVAEDLRFVKDAVADKWWKLQGKIEEWQDSAGNTHGGDWHDITEGEGKIDLNDRELAETIASEMSHKDLDHFLEECAVVMPLYLYDHSLLSISAENFINRAPHAEWDSGQVGYIYITKQEIEKEYGAVNDETIGRARAVLQSEVETYDYYLRGNSYGYTIEKDGAAIDSCWGFIGDFDSVKVDMISQAGSEYASMFERVDEVDKEYEFTEKDLQIEESEEMEV